MSPGHMTVNFVVSSGQEGNPYPVMATLYLPSLWSKVDITSLQVGLARALASYFSISVEAVHVVTRLIESGCVVEGGEELTW